MDISPLLHALCAVAAQILVGLFTGNWAYGAIAGCTFFIAREHTQAGKRKLTAVCSHQTRIGNLDAHLI
ncbi:hypothetical protein AB2H89_23550 [Escherichia coli]